jgi:hypothetical protein
MEWAVATRPHRSLPRKFLGGGDFPAPDQIAAVGIIHEAVGHPGGLQQGKGNGGGSDVVRVRRISIRHHGDPTIGGLDHGSGCGEGCQNQTGDEGADAAFLMGRLITAH